MSTFVNINEVFASMSSRVNQDAIAGVNAVVQFDLSGAGGGTWHGTIANNTFTVAEGPATNPIMTVMAEAADYLAIANGELSAMQAFMQGKVKVKGDLGFAMKFQGMFG
jgi:putative sterol carrier protein